MSTDDIDEFYVHTITVEMFLGTNGYGADTFAAPVTLTGFFEPVRHLVRDKDGEQVVSESSFYSYPINAPVFEPDSRVTVDGVVARVIKAAAHTSGGMDLPDHVAVALT